LGCDFTGALAHGVVGVGGFDLAAFVDFPQPSGVVVFKGTVAAFIAGAITIVFIRCSLFVHTRSFHANKHSEKELACRL
jgi:hypothetical protein